ncbi:MAG: hypothetical protein E6G83_09430 [Alphaproteobacteria bacterium]|nr:MAG: hypothetical protein E6G83_09430 [Alphaproteobacteria bacterium]
MRVTVTATTRSTASIALPVPIVPTRRLVPAQGPGSARCWAAPPGFSPASAHWQFLGSGRWWPQVRWLPPLPAPGSVRRLADLSGRWSRQAFRGSTLTYMPRRFAEAGPW